MRNTFFRGVPSLVLLCGFLVLSMMNNSRQRTTTMNFAVRKTAAIVLLAALAPVVVAEPSGEPEKPRKIYAHYMGNYPVAHGGTNYHRNIQAPGLRHDQPAHPNVAAWRNFSLVPENLSLSLEQSMDLEIRRALRAGIDGFAVDMWSGGEKECKEVIAAMFKVAEEQDYPFEITLCWDTPWQDSGDQSSQLRW